LSPTGWDASSQHNPHSIDTELSWIHTETMFNRITSIKSLAPSGLEALRAGRPKLRQRTDQPQPKADRPQVDLAEPRLKELLTADSRRFAQIKIRRFHRRDAEYAEVRIFAQSGDNNWAKDLVFRRDMFLFVVVSRQTKKPILCALCVSAVNKFFSARIGKNRRLIAFDALLPVGFASCFASSRLAPWNTDSTQVKLFARSAIPRGELSSPGFRNPKVHEKFQK